MNWKKALDRISQFGEPSIMVDSSGNPISCSLRHKEKIVEFLTNGDWLGDDTSVCNFHVRNEWDHPDSQTDYFPGQFFDTLTATIQGAEWEPKTERKNGYDHGTDRFSPLANLITEHRKDRLKREYPTYPDDLVERETKVKIVPGKKHTKIDVGSSGVYMVDNATGVIYGIKGYGVVHKGHTYGTLDTIQEWYWGGYRATKR